MSNTLDTPSDASSHPAGETGAGSDPAARRRGGLATMLIADLKTMAAGLGVAGAGSMKKAQLVEAIKQAQSAPAVTAPSSSPSSTIDAPVDDDRPRVRTRQRGEAARRQGDQAAAPAPAQTSVAAAEPDHGQDAKPDAAKPDAEPDAAKPEITKREITKREMTKQDVENHDHTHQNSKSQHGKDQDTVAQDGSRSGATGSADQQNGNADQAEADGEGRRGRRRRGRDRNRADGSQAGSTESNQADTGRGQGQPDAAKNNQGQGNHESGKTNQGQGNQGQGNANQGNHNQRHQREPDTTVLDDDVLVPAAGILDVLENYAFVRTSGYLPGPDDVYLSLSMVRKYGLRRGDALTGQVRQPREGERKEKFNPMVRIDAVNGAEPAVARERPDFAELTPVHPTQRLRLETAPSDLTGRLVDLVSPVGKGQRGLVVAPSRSGATTLLSSLATSVTTNHPECHLMVVLVDQRPEEVTDFERSVKGEVIASTFDRPPADHVVVAELAIERAKRLVELGHDVVVLLDGLTRLGRAYQQTAPPAGRSTPGTTDAAALHPTKRFFGAARCLEDTGSLTIIATAQADGRSSVDELVLEEVEATANLELRLRRDLADRGRFPAVDVRRSSTRRDDCLLGEEERAIAAKLRTALAEVGEEQAHQLVLGRLSRTQTNIEMLSQVRAATTASLAKG